MKGEILELKREKGTNIVGKAVARGEGGPYYHAATHSFPKAFLPSDQETIDTGAMGE